MSKLQIIDLHVSVEGKEILKGVNLELNTGEFHVIMGPNGTGKSTLASTIMGHYKYQVTQGQILLDGEDVLAMNVDEKRTFGQYIEDYAIEFSQQLLIIKSLCNKSNIVITEQEDIDEIADYISGIEAAFGGKDYFEIELSDLGFSREGIKKLKEYSYLYDLLFDSRYGKNGTAKLPEVDVKKYFVENYIRCDGVFYSYYNEGAPIKYEYTDDEIEEYFNDKYVKVRHILYSTKNLSKEKAEAKKQKATDAFNAIKNGEKLFEDFVKDAEVKA